MPKDYQEEITKIAEEISLRYLELIAIKKTVNPVTHDWVRAEIIEALTLHSNAQVEEIIKIAETIQKKYETSSSCRSAFEDFIQAIKK